MHLPIHIFLSGFVALQATLAIAQDAPSSSSSSTSCTFSCPPTNLLSWPLAKREYTIGFNSFYSIFECVYANKHATPRDIVSEHKCSYNKHSGSQALDAAGDNCPPEAVPCPPLSPDSSSDSEIATTSPPAFSHIDREEIVPWIEGGRYLLYLIEHPPS